MKSLLKKLPVVAFVLAIVSAFAFNVPNEEVVDDHWFEYNGSSIGSYIGTNPGPECNLEDGNICALAFDESDTEIVDGERVLKSGVEPGDMVDDAYKLF